MVAFSRPTGAGTCFISTLNVRGLSRLVKKLDLAADLLHKAILICAIQETLCPALFGQLFGEYAFYTSGAFKGTAGVGFVIHKSIDVIDFVRVSSRLATITVNTPTGNVLIHSCYAPVLSHTQADRNTFWAAFRGLPHTPSTITMGDFNAHISPEQIYPNIPPPRDLVRTCSNGTELLTWIQTSQQDTLNLGGRTAWADRKTYRSASDATVTSVIDYIFVHTSRKGNFESTKSLESNILTDHLFIKTRWSVKIHSKTVNKTRPPPPAPPTAVGEDNIITETLYKSLQQLLSSIDEDASIPPIQLVPIILTPVPSAKRRREDLQDAIRQGLPYSLRQQKRRELNDALRVDKAALQTAIATELENYLDLHHTQAACRLIDAARKPTINRSYTKREKENEHKRFSAIYAPTDVHLPPHPMLTENFFPLHQAPSVSNNPDHTVFTDGSYALKRTGFAVADLPTDPQHDVHIIFGNVDPSHEQSPNAGEAFAVLAARTFKPLHSTTSDCSATIKTSQSLAADANSNFAHQPEGNIWRQIYRLSGGAPLMIHHCLGHTGNPGNEIANAFAYRGGSLPNGVCQQAFITTQQAHNIINLAWLETRPANETQAERDTAKAATLAAQRVFVNNILSDHHQTPPVTHDECPFWTASDEAPTRVQTQLLLSLLNQAAAPGSDLLSGKLLNEPRALDLTHTLLHHIWTKKSIPTLFPESQLVGIPKPNDCTTRGIALTQVLLKCLMLFIKLRTRVPLLECQYGFTKRKGTDHGILFIRNVIQKRLAQGKATHCLFLDLSKAFDSIRRDHLNLTLRKYGFSETAATIIDLIYAHDRLHLYINNDLVGEPILPNRGVRQGCIISPTIFNIMIDIAIRLTLVQYPSLTNVHLDNGPITGAYADDMAILAADDQTLTEVTNKLLDNLAKLGLEVNAKKTYVMRCTPATSRGETRESYENRCTNHNCHKDANTQASSIRTASGATPQPNATAMSLHCSNNTTADIGCPFSDCPFKGTADTVTPAATKVKSHLNSEMHFPNAQIHLHKTAFAPHQDPNLTHFMPSLTPTQFAAQRPQFLPDLICKRGTFTAITEFKYLGSMISADGNNDTETSYRVQQANIAYGSLRRSGAFHANVSIAHQISLYKMYIPPVLHYCLHTWIPTKAQLQTLQQCTIRHLRTILHMWGPRKNPTAPEQSDSEDSTNSMHSTSDPNSSPSSSSDSDSDETTSPDSSSRQSNGSSFSSTNSTTDLYYDATSGSGGSSSDDESDANSERSQGPTLHPHKPSSAEVLAKAHLCPTLITTQRRRTRLLGSYLRNLTNANDDEKAAGITHAWCTSAMADTATFGLRTADRRHHRQWHMLTKEPKYKIPT